MKVCEERDLPVALKIGAHRGVNPSPECGRWRRRFADAGMLGRLCSRFRLRFLAIFSRNNQHEACVLVSKFGTRTFTGWWSVTTEYD
jgi:hypothetical protein